MSRAQLYRHYDASGEKTISRKGADDMISRRRKILVDQLVEDLNDNAEPRWICPHCGSHEHKGGADPKTLAPVPYSLQCQGCGFDAKPFAPEQLLNHPRSS